MTLLEFLKLYGLISLCSIAFFMTRVDEIAVFFDIFITGPWRDRSPQQFIFGLIMIYIFAPITVPTTLIKLVKTIKKRQYGKKNAGESKRDSGVH